MSGADDRMHYGYVNGKGVSVGRLTEIKSEVGQGLVKPATGKGSRRLGNLAVALENKQSKLAHS